MTRLDPSQIRELHSSLGPWNPDHNPDMSTEQQTEWVLGQTAAVPESRRRWVNTIGDFLADDSLDDEDKHDFITEATNRAFATPAESIDWLRCRLEELEADRQATRTTSGDGKAPYLRRIYDLHPTLRQLGRLSDLLIPPAEAAEFVAGLRDAKAAATDLLALANSRLSDRAKADFIVEHIGPYFYSDLEAIEWAAAVARAVLDQSEAATE